MSAQTGITFGVPETSIAAIGTYALDRPPGAKDGVMVGSLQQFERTRGELGAQKASVVRKMPASECSRMAINDIIGLNTDRHPGNFLIRDGANGPSMVPIDHGNNLPPVKQLLESASLQTNFGGIQDGTKQLGGIKNVLLTMPGTYERLDDDMLDRLSLLDPAAVAEGMTAHLRALDRTSPNQELLKAVDPASIVLSQRSMEFLKLAAPSLSPAVIQIAISQNFDLLADPRRDIAAEAPAIIADMQLKADAFQEFFTAPTDRRDWMLKQLKANGWSDPHKLMMEDPVAALNYIKNGAQRSPIGSNPIPSTDRRATLLAGIRDILAQTLQNLEAVQPIGIARLVQQHDALRDQDPTDEVEAAALNVAVRAFSDEMDDICLDALRVKGERYFAANQGSFVTINGRASFLKSYTDGFLREVGVLRSIRGAKRFLEEYFPKDLVMEQRRVAAEKAARDKAARASG